MKFFLTNFGEGNNVDNLLVYVLGSIPKYSIHQIVNDINEADAIIFIHTFQQGFVFKELDIKNKPIIIMDYLEGHCWIDDPYFVGFKMIDDIVVYDEYVKLYNYITSIQHQIKIYFKREYFIDSPKIPIPTYPIDFTANEAYYWKDTTSRPEDFWNRECDIAWIWGLSSPSRPILHGEMMKKYGGGYLCLDEQMFDYNKDKHKIVLFYKPFYMRTPFELVMDIYGKSKIAVALWGCGRKCFRDTEASFNSVMALQESNYYYAYPWIDGENCIILPNKIVGNGEYQIDEEKSINKMNDYLNNPQELYKVYIAGKNNAVNYRIDNYLTKYVLPKIEQVL